MRMMKPLCLTTATSMAKIIFEGEYQCGFKSVRSEKKIYQLGMTLWALATENDEPERECRPLHSILYPGSLVI